MACVVYSPDGTRLASAGYPIAKIWDALTGQEKFALRGHKYATTSIAYSHDGQQVATAGFDQTVRVWEAATGKELVKLQGHSGNVMSVAFSPDDKPLASASSLTGNVKVWDISSQKETLTLRGHTRSVTCVSFSPEREKDCIGECRQQRQGLGCADRPEAAWPTADIPPRSSARRLVQTVRPSHRGAGAGPSEGADATTGKELLTLPRPYRFGNERGLSCRWPETGFG